MESPNLQSRIPRSRLPVPRAVQTVRASPSRDSLTAPDPVPLPRLRATSSRDQLSSNGKRVSSYGTVKYSPLKSQTQEESNHNNASRRPAEQSNPAGQEDAPNPTEKSIPKKLHNGLSLAATTENGTISRKPRQSLSERTMETLSQVPPSPAVRRRESAFFNPESPMRSPSRNTSSSRPGSSYQQDASMPPPARSANSRPSSSAGTGGDAVTVDFRASTNTVKLPNSSINNGPTTKGLVTTKVLKNSLKAKSNVNLRSNVTPSKSVLPTPGFVKNHDWSTPTKATPTMTPSKFGSNTVASRAPRSRASVGGLFRKPSMPELDRASDDVGRGLKKSVANSTQTSLKVALATPKTPKQIESKINRPTEQLSDQRKSSFALREQIAKAKAVKRAQGSGQVSGTQEIDQLEETPIIPAETFDFGLNNDPFNQQTSSDGTGGLLRKRVDSARTDGRLNIAAMGLKEIPVEVMDMYNFDAINDHGGSWAESVDLTRFVAADNELEVLGDDIFPDVDPHEHLGDDDAGGNQFGGLETLDLHGNCLKALPIGLRRLSLLTTLNLSYNKLSNGCFDVISQIGSLKDLKLGHNDLTGELSSGITKLQYLEFLDVQHNSLSSIPKSVAKLARLRVLNLSENAFSSLQFEILHQLPLVELSVARNKLEGVLIQIQDSELPTLQILNISGNSITNLALNELKLPALHHLNCSMNRLTGLPNMTSWQSLLTLIAENNNILSIPEGFVELTKVKNVDLTGNNIKILDDRIGHMEGLDIFRISGNPLREKKLSSMTTENLKKVLRARIAPPETELGQEESSEVFTSCPSSPARPSTSSWPVKAGGVLDRSNTQSYSLDPVIATEIAINNAIRLLDLRHNLFKMIPGPVALFASTLTTLVISHNDLANGSFINEYLNLSTLKELNLSCNTISSLDPLTTYLHAPALEKLDISFNRLSTLPILRSYFPQLTVFLASNNSIKDLHPDTIKGLKVVNCSSNDIETLNPLIGLLGAPGDLEKLDVSGNRFRVPKYTVLEKGTEATLKWLKDRIPVGEDGGLDLDVD